ncbi:Annexin [Atractiella rhizophila]|nr:Annexin [Atractiella rhizophila]
MSYYNQPPYPPPQGYGQGYNVGYSQGPPQPPYPPQAPGGYPGYAPYPPPPAPSSYGPPPPIPYGAPPGAPPGPPPPIPAPYGAPPPGPPAPNHSARPPPPGAPPTNAYGAPVHNPNAPPAGAGTGQWVSGGHSYGDHSSQAKPTYLGCVLLLDPSLPPPPYPPPVSLPTYNAAAVNADVQSLRNASKGFGTDESALIRTLISTKNANLEVQTLRNAFAQQTGKTLIDELKGELSSWFEFGMTGIVFGPVEFDVELIERASAGIGTKEDLLTEILLGRSSQEMSMLKAEYQRRTRRQLEARVQGELSLKTERMFNIAMAARYEDLLQPPQQIESLLQSDLQALNNSLRTGRTDEIGVCSIILARSPKHLHELQKRYQSQNRKTLTKVIKSHFSGHMEQGLVYVLNGAKKDTTGAWRDAKWIEKSMKGMGTKDNELVYRVLRAAWNPQHFVQVSLAYQSKYKKSLKDRIRGETSGKYRDMLVAIYDNATRLGSVTAFH